MAAPDLYSSHIKISRDNSDVVVVVIDYLTIAYNRAKNYLVTPANIITR